MQWFYFAVLAATAFGLLAGTSKKLLKTADVYIFTALLHITGLVVFTPYLIYNFNISNIPLNGIVLAVLSGLLNCIAVYFFNSSIHLGELSEQIPLTRLSPVFTAILGFLILNETMNLSKVSGILLMTAGSILVLKEPGYSIMDSFKKIFTEKAAGLAVLSSIMYALTSIIDRAGTQLVRPQIYLVIIYSVIAVSFTLIAVRKSNSEFKKVYSENWLLYLVSGVLTVTGSLSIFHAFSLAEASMVMPILQLQAVIAVGIGGVYFKEKQLLLKTIGVSILILGLVFLL